MKVVTTFHQPSSILSSIKCRLSTRDTENLIVAKLNKVIVYSIQPHGLRKECSADVWGKVLTIKVIPIPVRVDRRPEIIHSLHCLEVAPIQSRIDDSPP